MREKTINRTFEASAAELFERATEDGALELKLLKLTHKQDVDISEWTKKDNHAARVIAYVFAGIATTSLSDLTKSSDLSMSKFEDTFSNEEKTEFVIEYKIFYGQTQAVSDIRVLLQQNSEASATECTVVIKNSCRNSLIRDQAECSMEEHVIKDMNLWLDLLWERHGAHKAIEIAPKPIEASITPPLQATTPSPIPMTSLRPMTAKSYTWSSHDLHELGEIEEMKVLNGGLSNLADELDSLRRTVESHYVRLCSLSSHLASQSVGSGANLRSQQIHSNSPSPHALPNGLTPNNSNANQGNAQNNAANNANANASDAQSRTETNSSSSRLVLANHRDQHTSHQMAFNSLEELEARQRALRLQLTAQMQNIEKSFLKQQQASQQIKTLEARWDNMINKMSKRLQEIDTLRYGLLGSWRYSVSILCFIILWPLIVRYAWISFGKRWARSLAARLAWKRQTIAKVIQNQTSQAVAASTSKASTNVTTNTGKQILSKLIPTSFWR